jgi:iron(III) transport system permease protein
LSGVFVLALATMIFFATQKSFTTLRFLDFFNLGYGLPGTLLAVALYIFFSRFLNIKVLSDQNLILFLIISLLYFVKFSGLALRGLDSQQKQIDPKILESASLLADSQKVFWKIELKLYKPAIGLGLFLLILEIIKELPAALMIKPLQSPTLAVRIHQYASESDWARASVYSLLLLFLVGLLLVLKRLAETETK